MPITHFFCYHSICAALLLALITNVAAAQPRNDRRVVVTNHSDRIVFQFHATNTTVRAWGIDRLARFIRRSFRCDSKDGDEAFGLA